MASSCSRNGNQRGGDRNDLARRHVHVLDFVRRLQLEFALEAAGDQFVGQLALLVERCVGLGDDVVAFLDRRQVLDLLGDVAAVNLAVRRFHEAVLVGARIQRQRVDQADVRAFRRFDRADAAVVRRMHVAHLEAGALAGQAARAERRDAPLVGDLRQRVGLVHELRQLAGTEELLDRGTDRLGVDQVVRHQVVGLGLGQALLDGTLDAHQAGTELVLGQFADRTDATVAQVIDVVDFATTVAQFDQDADDVDDVVVGQGCRADQLLAADAAVELHAADGRQVVALFGVEQAVEQRLRRRPRWAARPDASCGRWRRGRPTGRPFRRCAGSRKCRRRGPDH